MAERAKKDGFPAAVASAFGGKLRRHRRASELSQEELGQRTGLSRASIAMIEGGRQNAQLHHVYLFARALDVPAVELLPTSDEVKKYQRPSAKAGGGRSLALAEEVLEEIKAVLALQLEKGLYARSTDETRD
jgi:transcriptional regulator with XRE-family HTH domain